jgi:hypothetical protein
VHAFFEQLAEVRGVLSYVVLTREEGKEDEEASAYALLRRYIPGSQIRKGKWWLFEDMPKLPRTFPGEICPCGGPLIW